LRASSVNTFARSTRTLRSRTSQQCLRLSQQPARREYSSAKDTVKKASSDIPWLVSAIAVTIGGTYAALLPRSDPHDEHHDNHGEEHGEEHEEKEEPAEEEGGEEKASSDDAEKEDAPKEEDTDSDESEDKPKSSSSAEVSNKGMTKSASNTVKHEDTSTGKKLRLDSTAGTKIGEGSSSGDGDAMADKQRAISNTDTKHSADSSKDPNMSNKGEGTVETAKIKGTVDPNRPQV